MADFRWALAVGGAAGALEAAIRSSSSRGLELGASAALVAGTVVIAATFTLLATLAARLARPALARHVASAVGGTLVAAVTVRYELVLNELVRDPRVFLGVPAAALLGGAAGAMLLPRLPLRPLVVMGAACLLLAVVRDLPRRGAPSPRPSVLVISMDTTRADAVGGKPTWERLASEGTVFDQAVAAAPITEPSHLAMFTGVAPFRSGILSNGTRLGERPLVWKRFRAAGYLTAGFVSGFPLHGRYGWSQGMDVWDDDFGRWPGLESLTLVKAWNQVALREHALRERNAARLLSRAGPWLAAHRDETFFAFVHLYDAHGPYVSAHATLGAPPTDGPPLALPPFWPPSARAITSVDWLRAAYDAEVTTVDDAVGALLAALGDRLDHTIVVVTADHGESLTEHGVLFDHGDDLYEPSLRVPLAVRWPGHVAAGRRLDCQVGGVDLAPTFLELAGLPDAVTPDGRSLASTLLGGDCVATPVVSSTTAGRFVDEPPVDHSLRGGGHKVLLKQTGPVELYDLLSDPGELQNLAPSPDANVRAAVLAQILRHGGPTEPAAMDAATRAALIELGYLDAEEEP
ncbi:MAG: hypothetical protein EXR71_00810 [Myxococcales bacterium]|nr:hypothetical protein [Myxococcales bacterium]